MKEWKNKIGKMKEWPNIEQMLEWPVKVSEGTWVKEHEWTTETNDYIGKIVQSVYDT